MAIFFESDIALRVSSPKSHFWMKVVFFLNLHRILIRNLPILVIFWPIIFLYFETLRDLGLSCNFQLIFLNLILNLLLKFESLK